MPLSRAPWTGGEVPVIRLACAGSVIGAGVQQCWKRAPAAGEAVEVGRRGPGVALDSEVIGPEGVEGDEDDAGGPLAAAGDEEYGCREGEDR